MTPNRVNRAHGPTKENRQNFDIFGFFRPTQKMAWDGPKWGRDVIFLANPDLADILGNTDFDFENFIFLILLDPKFPDVQVPDLQISRNLAWAQLGARLGPSMGLAWARLEGVDHFWGSLTICRVLAH